MHKILIVEDDPMLAEIYKKKFSQANFKVFMASSGMEAEETAAKEQPELMLLDLVLPEEDGFEVLKKLKQKDETKDIQIVIFSNLSQQEDKQKATDLGAAGFIAKSDFTPQQIVDEVRKYLKDSGETPAKEPDEAAGPSAPKSTQPANGRPKALIIEDEEVFIEVFGMGLERAGFKVDVANNGAWGIEKISKERYDIILADILMPETDGLEVIRKTRSGGLNQKTPIIAFSNSIDDGQVEEILKAGANEVMVKTRVTPSELVVKVKAVMGN